MVVNLKKKSDGYNDSAPHPPKRRALITTILPNRIRAPMSRTHPALISYDIMKNNHQRGNDRTSPDPGSQTIIIIASASPQRRTDRATDGPTERATDRPPAVRVRLQPAPRHRHATAEPFHQLHELRGTRSHQHKKKRNQLAFKINWFARFSWNSKQRSARALASPTTTTRQRCRRRCAVDAIGGAEREKIAPTEPRQQGNKCWHNKYDVQKNGAGAKPSDR